jgi:hypothetical protein
MCLHIVKICKSSKKPPWAWLVVLWAFAGAGCATLTPFESPRTLAAGRWQVAVEARMMATRSAAGSDLPVFPGAVGYGSTTPAGRGGRVIEVTSLDDDGPGSLREAVAASGPRIVVFRLGGLITLTRHLEIHEPFLTLAGQTAPGDGILVNGAGIVVFAHERLGHCAVALDHGLRGGCGSSSP